MPSEDFGQRAPFGDLLAELTDSDVVVEIVTDAAASRTPDAAQIQRLREAIEASYRALAGPVPLRFETVAVVEEIARRSFSLWLRAQRSRPGTGEDDASMLKFLARGTLAILAWMDGSSTHQLADLQQAIRVLAWGTSVTTSAQPVLPSSADLVTAIGAWQKAKAAVAPGASVRIRTTSGSAEIDLGKTIPEPRALLRSRTLVNHSADMIFVVEMPDYKGTGQWQLKHGDTRTTAVCEPGTLLDKFYRRELDIRPGDALRCRVDFETSYGPDHEVLSERFRIVEILEVLPASRGNADPEPPTASQLSDSPAEAELEPAS